nr:VOC family protein [Francisella halioticida]
MISPKGSKRFLLLLAKASNLEQKQFIGNQTGGRVFLFLNTTDFWTDYNRMKSLGVEFIRDPSVQEYGIVAVFKDLYGNLCDLLQLKESSKINKNI